MPKDLYKGSMFPPSPPEPSTLAADAETDFEVIKTPLNRPSQTSIDVSPETDEFISYMNNSLRLRNPPLFADFKDQSAPSRPRDTSSSYGSEANDLTRVHSPASPPPGNTLRESNLSKYSMSNHLISDLDSPSDSSGDSGGDSTKVAVDEAAIAIKEWQTELRPEKLRCYNRRKTLDSQELTPSESASQIHNRPPTPRPQRVPKPHWFGRLTGSNRPSLDSSIQGLKDQFDGGGDYRIAQSPDPRLQPCAPRSPGEAGQKRKASVFSFRSLSIEIPRNAKKLKVLANSVYKQSARHLGHAKQKWKQQNEKERKRFEAWKANRRRDRPADPLKGKPEAGFGKFSLDQSRHGHKDWWQEGVCRYQAPSWMVFGGI